MTHKETIKILGVLKAAYPAFYKDMGAREREGIVALWQMQLSELPYNLVAAAVNALISTDEKGYPPHIGAVKNMALKIAKGDELTEMEAWGKVSQALRHSAYHSQREFEKLPGSVQKVVGSAEQLKTWAMMSDEEVESVVQSNFMRSFRARTENDRQQALMPGAAKRLALQAIKLLEE